MRNLLKWILTLIAVAALYCGTSMADIVDSGTCGENAAWTLDDQGLLTISGTGAMADFSSGAPWFEIRGSVQSLEIKSGITCIGANAFEDCTNLTHVSIPDSVTSLGSHAFYYCTGLTSVILPDSVTWIGSYAMNNCRSLAEIHIPNSLTRIDEYAFSDCRSLCSITLPDQLTSIPENAFCFCDRMTSMTIPDSVTSIGNSALQGCQFIKDVYYTGTEAQWNQISVGTDNEVLSSAAIHYQSTPGNPSGIISSSLSLGLDEEGTLILSVFGAMTGIPVPAPWAEVSDSITAIEIRNGISAIGDDAFSYPIAASSVYIPRSVKHISTNAFQGCNDL